MSTVAVILLDAFGGGMKSNLPGALHPILGDPALLWTLRALPGSVAEALVVHRGGGLMDESLEDWRQHGLLPCPCAVADPESVVAELDRRGAQKVLVLYGGSPLLERGTLAGLADSEGGILAMDLEDPAGYDGVEQHPDGTLRAVLAAGETGGGRRRVDGGACLLPRRALDAAQKEGAFRPAEAAAALAGRMPVAVTLCDPAELLALRSRRDQAVLQALARNRINDRWLDEGATLLDPDTTLVGPRVQLARDVVLEPGVRLEGGTTVGEGARIGQGTVIRDSRIGPGAEIRPYCVIQRSEVGAGAQVGPFAHLREGSVLEAQVHVGNFVETKKATLRAGAKANHLSYLGDAEIGERTNIGAGFISCNYDGFSKHRTTIGKDAFVGSDCQCVAPVTVGDRAILGAGSTITKDVPDGAIALSRAPQVVKEAAAHRLREKLRARHGKG